MLTSIFLIILVSATSATPTGQPGEESINDGIHARMDLPIHLCRYPYNWARRECLGSLGPTAWQDVCSYRGYRTNMQTVYDNKRGDCPAGTYCLDGFNNGGRRTISCVSLAQAKGKRKLDPQFGTSEAKRARTGLTNTQFEYSVTIDHDMTGAAVAAVFESKCQCRTVNVCRIYFFAHVGNQLNLGKDGSFLIAPNNVIVGNVHGKQETVCKGDLTSPTKARECYPNDTYDFTAGQTIDFTWGTSGDQEGMLLYGIIPAEDDS